MAILLLLVVVAVAIRFLLGASQATTHDTTILAQSVQAYLLAASGQERAVALLKSAIPNEIGKLDAQDCSASAFGPGPHSLGAGAFTFTAVTPTDLGCDNLDPNQPDTCTGCDVQVTATVGPASRVLNLSVNYSSTAGVTGFGTTVTQRLRTTVKPSAAVFNLAYRRQMANLGGGQATVTLCAGCDLQWDIESSSGSPSVGGQAVYDRLLEPGTYTVSQTLSAARNYAEVGLLLEQGSGGDLRLVGSYADDKGGIGKKTTGTSNTVTGEVTNGAANDGDWCRGKDTGSPPSPPSPPFANMLVFGFSGRATTTADTLTKVEFNCEDPNNAAKCVNPVLLTRYQRQEGYAGDLYSEIWVAMNPDHTSIANDDYPAGTTDIVVTKVGPVDPVSGSRVAIKGNGQVQPGTTITFNATTSTITLNLGLKKAVKKGDVICGGTCAFFDHSASKTAFNIAKTAGTTQWASGFMCLKGVGNVVPIFQGSAKPVVWYEPF